MYGLYTYAGFKDRTDRDRPYKRRHEQFAKLSGVLSQLSKAARDLNPRG